MKITVQAYAQVLSLWVAVSVLNPNQAFVDHLRAQHKQLRREYRDRLAVDVFQIGIDERDWDKRMYGKSGGRITLAVWWHTHNQRLATDLNAKLFTDIVNSLTSEYAPPGEVCCTRVDSDGSRHSITLNEFFSLIESGNERDLDVVREYRIAKHSG